MGVGREVNNGIDPKLLKDSCDTERVAQVSFNEVKVW